MSRTQRPESLNFVNTLSRYIEVSHVYWNRLSKEKDNFESDRLSSILALIEAADIPSSTSRPILSIKEEETGGQSVVPTAAVLEQTKYYQEIVLEHLNEGSEITPRNLSALKNLMHEDPGVFLNAFKTVSYSWDILSELTSISFLPSTKKLAARDLIHMHVVELRQHLYRLCLQALLLSPENLVHLNSEYSIAELIKLNENGSLVRKIVKDSVQKDILEISELLIGLIDNADIKSIIQGLKAQPLNRLEQETNGFYDMLNEQDIIKNSETICNDLVVYGLAIGYAIWLRFARQSKNEYDILLKHCLFCTKSLLDEKRWYVCKYVSEICKHIAYDINKHSGEQDSHKGAYMVEANWLFSKKKLGDRDVNNCIQTWDLQKAHSRYKFLQCILLDRFDENTLSLAKKMLEFEETGKPNMSTYEFTQWPILEGFRNSIHWTDFSKLL